MDENLKAIVNLEDDERCLKTLYMSYKQLPVHLKSCFLYVGIYPEDHKIRISNLVKLWVAEGFLKPISGKRLEDVARAYLKDLIDRNFVLIHKLGSIGSIKECKIHDLLRDLCLREAQKEGFYRVYRGDNMSWILMFLHDIEEIDASSSAPLARSLILDFGNQYQPSNIFKFPRLFGSYMESDKFVDNVRQLARSRFLNFTSESTEFPSLIWLFWNVQTLTVTLSNFDGMVVPTDAWYMSSIRHLCFSKIYLPDPPLNVQDGIVLANLQSLGCVRDFICSEQMVKTIPNIAELKISYFDEVDDRFCLTNLDCLDKLESLKCIFFLSMCPINYPQSLKKLAIQVPRSQCWQDVLDKIGDLPLLQKLTLDMGTFREGRGETTQGQFRSLKFLYLYMCEGLHVWTSEASHFPRLEQLHLLLFSDDLEKIPSDFADISTLRLIDLEICGELAYRILEEHEELHGEEDTSLQVQVKLYRTNSRELEKSFRSPNFHVTRIS